MQKERKTKINSPAILTEEDTNKLRILSSSLIKHITSEVITHATLYEKAKKEKELPAWWEELEFGLEDLTALYFNIYKPLTDMLELEREALEKNGDIHAWLT